MDQIKDERMKKMLAELAELREYDKMLSDVSTDMSLKYLKVFSITDISYQEYLNWKQVLPYYRNISEEGIILYAA